MNNEEKNLPQNDFTEQAEEIKETTPKGLSKGALIGIIAGAAAVVIALVVVLIIVLGGKCNHVDADDDYLCDNCGEHFDDGDEGGDPASSETEVTFNVVLDNGDTLAGVTFTLKRGDVVHTLTSGADGTVKLTLAVGVYEVEFDSDTLPEYCWGETYGVKIEEGTTSATLSVVDNRPDGSAKKPYTLTEDEVEITLASNQEIYYSTHGASTRYLTINSSNLAVTYNGQNYFAVDGVITVEITSANTDSPAIFSVRNIDVETVTTTMRLESPLGSNDNPIVMTESSATAKVPAEKTVYYTYMADKDGVLVLTTPTLGNSITITRYVTKIVDNNGVEESIIVPILAGTDSGSSAYIPVYEGEEIRIGVSFTAPKNSIELAETDEDRAKLYSVSFSISVYAGSESDPVPVHDSSIGLTLDAGQSFVFSYDAEKTLSVSGADYESSGGLVSVSNNSSESSGVSIKALAGEGTSENPIVVNDSSFTASVSAGSTLYYSWTATNSGILKLNSLPAGIDVLVGRDCVVLVETDGVFGVTIHPVHSGSYLYVASGDTLIFKVSNSGTDNVDNAEIGFDVYTGGKNTSVPVSEGEIALTLDPNVSITFSAEEGRTVKIADANGITVTYNGTAVEPNSDGDIIFTVAGETNFDLRTDAGSISEITLIIE